jgi:putative ABC transport system permease protein
LNEFYAGTVALYERQFAVLKLIILFMVALGVGNAVNMAMFERLPEFATMRALGNRSRQVVQLILLECAVLGMIGVLVGAAVGTGLAILISAVGIPMPPPPNSNVGYTAAIDIVPVLWLEATLIGFAATVFAGFIPALRAGRMAIGEALRHAV